MLLLCPGIGSATYWKVVVPSGHWHLPIYADVHLWGSLGRRVTAVTDPLATLAQYGWQPVKTVVGRVAGAMISTTSSGEDNHAETRLILEPVPPTTPYR